MAPGVLARSPSPEPPLSAKLPRPEAQEIVADIIELLSSIVEYTEYTYEEVEPEDGLLVARTLVEHPDVERRTSRVSYNSLEKTLWVRAMPTYLHDAHQQWVMSSMLDWAYDGLVKKGEHLKIAFGVGTRFEGFIGAYTSSSKEPDLYLSARTDRMPSVVIESGWSESFPRLRIDKDLWLAGTVEVEYVILLKWSKVRNNKVKGTIEVWGRGNTGSLLNRELVVFPKPDPLPIDDSIHFTKQQLFGANPVSNPSTVLSFEIPRLREIAEEILGDLMGLSPG
ncbi:hypothetical protein BO83DRAFT_319384 [Aspergillus eucalypticola CBS 122712]|uniref:Uncharacterized protein n=1 Tax=Aspergillus eucalypticola (strain CBS 122712 / IBT 29274) TaxID=1448314 RepID=A0A317V1S3_ASPEC|nr:uncharacterized protein BO83DRAFT_319384 [Aspergillus eucalypticola CBS 122712]PWY67038.1 hypothetical protein BO83DRAFT_319384 [Aspergillus eucalypticola CBS 122712]